MCSLAGGRRSCGGGSPSRCAGGCGRNWRRGEDPDAVAVSFVKVVKLQARAIPHYHTVIRLDAPATDSDGTVAPPQTSITAAELAALVQAAAHRVRLEVAAGEGRSRVLGFGEQIDTQPLSAASGADPDGAARRVAGYLAKYVTKSVADFGLWPARISPQACASLEVSAHVRGILFSLIALAGTGTEYAPMLAWLHTLGYRGHVTTKSRRFSVTLAALRAHRQSWRADHREHIPAGLLIGDPDDPTLGHAVGEDALQTVSDWSCTAVGHVCAADYYLAVSAAVRAGEYRRLARDAYHDDLGRDAHRTTWPRSDTNIARVFVASDHGTTVFLRASDVHLWRESGRAGVWPDPTTAAGGLRALTEQVIAQSRPRCLGLPRIDTPRVSAHTANTDLPRVGGCALRCASGVGRG